MRKLYSITPFLFILASINYCSYDSTKNEDENKINLTIKTIDSYGKPCAAEIIYEQQDCEYDFSTPLSGKTNNKGELILSITPGYLQVYAREFLHESYKCGFFSSSNTLTLYAAPIPTYIKVLNSSGKPVEGKSINYFPNHSGNCDLEQNENATTAITNKKGLVTIFLPQSETYKIQQGSNVICFQPSQTVETLTFIEN